MTETSYSLERDLAEAKSMAEGLEDYVRGDELYGSGRGGMFGSDPKMPKLTIGALLMRLNRLKAQQSSLTSAQWSTLTDVTAEQERVRREWTQHYDEKLQREATSRLQSISTFVNECVDDPAGCADNYRSTAQARTILQAALGALPAGSDVAKGVQSQDGQLQRLTEPAPFLWSKDLEPLYPKSTYWWLYTRPRQK